MASPAGGLILARLLEDAHDTAANPFRLFSGSRGEPDQMVL